MVKVNSINAPWENRNQARGEQPSDVSVKFHSSWMLLVIGASAPRPYLSILASIGRPEKMIKCWLRPEPLSPGPLPKGEGNPIMLAKLRTFSLVGIEALPVEVEVNVSPSGLPKQVHLGILHPKWKAGEV